PGFSGLRRQRERIRLGAAAREDHVVPTRADERRNLDPGGLDGCARGPSLGVDRRRIAVEGERRDDGVAHFVPAWLGGVIVTIGEVVHALPMLAARSRG